jgi:hypothetical protein
VNADRGALVRVAVLGAQELERARGEPTAAGRHVARRQARRLGPAASDGDCAKDPY